MRILCEPAPIIVLTLSLSKGEDGAHGARSSQCRNPPNKNAPVLRPGRLRLCRLTLTSPGSCAACATARGA
ncbi:hypothetical protein CA607_16395 [Caulobacter vibrioides]|nr:hypothetical protein CA607_16395 [Caulobacter vibrioides]